MKKKDKFLSDFTMTQFQPGGTMSRKGPAKTENTNVGLVGNICAIPHIVPCSIAIVVGILVTAAGCGLCAVGFYSKELAKVEVKNATAIFYTTDSSKYTLYRSMEYIGPVLCGTGCFIVIVAMVLILESWDRIKREMPEMKEKPKGGKLQLYDKLVKQLQGNRGKDNPDSSEKTTEELVDKPEKGHTKDRDDISIVSKVVETIKRKYSSISDETHDRKEFDKSNSSLGKAIARIPMEIFTVVPLSSISRNDFYNELEIDPNDRDMNANRTPTLTEGENDKPSFLFPTTDASTTDEVETTKENAKMVLQNPPIIIRSLYSSNSSITDQDLLEDCDIEDTDVITTGGITTDVITKVDSLPTGGKKLPPLKLDNRSQPTFLFKL